MLVRVLSDYYAAGLIVKNDRIVRTAPILRWTKKMKWSEAQRVLERRKCSIEIVEEET